MSTSSPQELLPYLHTVVARRHLTVEESREAMRVIVKGAASEGQIASFLTALAIKGETADELAGFARAMREAALPIPFESAPGQALLDTCGTGGDGRGTFNISTAVAFVVAGCGVRIAKHGNRGVSSACGSADVLDHLGVTIAVTGEQAARSLREIGICFLFAPAFHPTLQVAQKVRRELRFRTVFNLLGPLSNPAPTSCQIVGAPSLDAGERIASALSVLGLKRGFVFHGNDGLDEVTLTTSTTVWELGSGKIKKTTVEPETFGFSRVNIEELRGGDPAENARILVSVLDGERGARRDIVVANAAMALIAAGEAETLDRGVIKSAESIDSGAAMRKLEELCQFIRRSGGASLG